MARFIYKAKSGPGKTVDGELEAGNQGEAIARLDAMGYTPIWIRETSAVGRLSMGIAVGGISPRAVNVFTRQLASLLKAGVPILRALTTVREQTENPRLRRIVGEVEHSVRDGKMLSDSLTRYPATFTDLYINMVRSGEAGGVLPEILVRVAEAREKEEETAAKVRSAVAYPAMVLSVGVATVFIMVTFFLPRIARMFENSEQLLPLPTRILISISGFFSQYWYWMLFLVVLAWGLAKRLSSSSRGRMLSDRLILGLPLVGRFMLEADVARFARTLHLLVQTEIPIDRAIDLSGRTVRNSVLRGELDEVRRNTVQKGMPVAESLRKTRTFPLFVANMVAVGEESGRLEESLLEIATFYEKELDQRIKLATSLLEPILILVIGSIVGFIIFAMLMPIFQIGQTLG